MAKKKTDNQAQGAAGDEAAFVAQAASDIDAAQQIGELTEHLQRLQAEFDNYRRRVAEQQASVMDLAKQDVVLQLLPLIDNVDRALAHVPAELADNPWAKGVAAVAKQAGDVLSGLGVEQFGQAGDDFDPRLHEAIAFEDSTGEHEVIGEVIQAGYKLGEKVIRHAIVKVYRSES